MLLLFECLNISCVVFDVSGIVGSNLIIINYEQMSLTKLKQTLKNHKKELYFGLFAAGCTTVLYGLYKDQ